MADLTFVFEARARDDCITLQLGDVDRRFIEDIPGLVSTMPPHLNPAPEKFERHIIAVINGLIKHPDEVLQRLTAQGRDNIGVCLAWFMIWREHPGDPPRRVAMREELARRCGYDDCTIIFTDRDDDANLDIRVVWQKYSGDGASIPGEPVTVLTGLGDGAHRWRH